MKYTAVMTLIAVVCIVAILSFLVYMFVDHHNYVKKATDYYEGKTVKLESDLLEGKIEFRVREVFVRFNKEIWLTGTLVFRVPDGYQYQGAGRGSKALNFLESDGVGGKTYFLEDHHFRLKEGWKKDKVRINIEAIEPQ